MAASALMNVMTNAARKAARGLTRDFGEVEKLQVSVKGPSNFVTRADMKAEQIIFEELSKARPAYCFLMEEQGAVEGTDKSHRWIIDPLDGTTNYLHGIPMWAISIALERDGEIVAGLIYNPVMEETFTAEKGKGAFLNDQRIRVAARRELSECVMATGIPHRGRPGHERFLKEVEAAMAQTSGIRRNGSAALDLAWLAAGRFDGFWERGIHAWDMAAGVIIAREAGAIVTDMDGGEKMLETGEIMATNYHLRRKFETLLKG